MTTREPENELSLSSVTALTLVSYYSKNCSESKDPNIHSEDDQYLGLILIRRRFQSV